MILTLDFGTSVTKAVLWGDDGPVASAGAPLATVHPAPGLSEQEPDDWWPALVAVCEAVRLQAPGSFGSIDVVGCTGARQTLALVDADGLTLGRAILWSDRRAGAEAVRLAGRGGTGDAGSVAAKIAWLAAREAGRLDASAWILAPRDLMVWRMTGTVATDPTMASRSGLYDREGVPVADLAGPALSRLAPTRPSDRVTGRLTPGAAEALGLRSGTPLVIGAGDRAAEVLGTGATASRPMVSWGTTANVSVPVEEPPPSFATDTSAGVVLSRAAGVGWLLEGGLSAAGSYVDWLGRLVGLTPAEVAAAAGDSPAGANGVIATPWLEGARAPWWQPEAGAAFVGLTSGHGVADLARSVFEAVAWDVERCLESMASVLGGRAEMTALALAGSGSDLPLWVEVLSGITGRPAERRRSGQAASAGAAILAALAVGLPFDLEHSDPRVGTTEPDAGTVAQYAAIRWRADEVAGRLVGLPAPSDRGETTCG